MIHSPGYRNLENTMNELQLLELIFQYVKKNAVIHKPAGGMGGIWSADRYTLGDVTAMLADDGSTDMVSFQGLTAWSTYGRPVTYGLGADVEMLKAAARTLGLTP